MRKLSAKVERIGKAGHEGENYSALAEGYGVSRNTVSKYVERYRKAHGLPLPRLGQVEEPAPTAPVPRRRGPHTNCKWCGKPGRPFCSASCASKDQSDKLAQKMGTYGIPGRGTSR